MLFNKNFADFLGFFSDKRSFFSGTLTTHKMETKKTNMEISNKIV